MSLHQVLTILLRRSWIVVLTFLTTVCLAGAILFLVPGRYDATATATVDPGDNPLAEGASGAAAIGMMEGIWLNSCRASGWLSTSRKD